ncbi:hypothetical protein J6590_029987 [Homalodisca vitripennis]|nr:hypothetical protein J6590_029987 [Homalodisca vitripennis]
MLFLQGKLHETRYPREVRGCMNLMRALTYSPEGKGEGVRCTPLTVGPVITRKDTLICSSVV